MHTLQGVTIACVAMACLVLRQQPGTSAAPRALGSLKVPAALPWQVRGSKFVKYQECKIQESPDEVPQGSTPRTLMAHLRGSLTRSLKAGDSVTLSGIFLPEPYTGQVRVGWGGWVGGGRALSLVQLRLACCLDIARWLSEDRVIRLARHGRRPAAAGRGSSPMPPAPVLALPPPLCSAPCCGPAC